MPPKAVWVNKLPVLGTYQQEIEPILGSHRTLPAAGAALRLRFACGKTSTG